MRYTFFDHVIQSYNISWKLKITAGAPGCHQPPWIPNMGETVREASTITGPDAQGLHDTWGPNHSGPNHSGGLNTQGALTIRKATIIRGLQH